MNQKCIENVSKMYQNKPKKVFKLLTAQTGNNNFLGGVLFIFSCIFSAFL